MNKKGMVLAIIGLFIGASIIQSATDVNEEISINKSMDTVNPTLQAFHPTDNNTENNDEGSCGCEEFFTDYEEDERVDININARRKEDVQQELTEINKAIRKNNADWIAGYNSVINSTIYLQGGGLGCIEEKIDEDEYEDVSFTGYVPDEFDWRDVDGIDWTTSIKSQGGCGSCVAFGTIAVLEAVVQIEIDQPIECDLSEAHLFSCAGGKCDEGMSLQEATGYIKGNGVSDESCFPYEPHDMSCALKCPEWKQRAVKISKAAYITPNVGSLKNALLQYGPLGTRMIVYSDFKSYNGGIYKHVSGEKEGGHCVAIVGYNNTERYWICKNSWGTNWGEKGWFRIKYDECIIGETTYYLSGSKIKNIDVTLSWSCMDTDGDFLYFDVYFGTNSNPPLISSGQTTTTYDPGPLSYSSTYYWKIVAEDEHGSKNEGACWRFTTNKPPYEPSKPSGLTSGTAGREYFYRSMAIEPDGDQIYYLFDWGDGTNSSWLGPFNSGATVEASHTWEEKGNYAIKVKAKDIYELEGEWSDPLAISMPKNKPYINTPFINFLEHHPHLFPLLRQLLSCIIY